MYRCVGAKGGHYQIAHGNINENSLCIIVHKRTTTTFAKPLFAITSVALDSTRNYSRLMKNMKG
jgi:hypothetical protein